MRPYVKRSFQAPRADMLPDMMRHAYSTMMSGRVGPVHLDVPLNVFNEKTAERASFSEDWRANVSYSSAADPAAVERATKLLLSAERPLILAGNGCLMARVGKDLMELAALTGIPIATTPQAKGVIDETDPVCLGPIGRDGVYPANRASRGCDVLLALGTRFGDRSASSWREGATHSIARTRFIHVDQDPGQLGRNYPPRSRDNRKRLPGLATDYCIFEATNARSRESARTPPRLARSMDRLEMYLGSLSGRISDDRPNTYPSGPSHHGTNPGRTAEFDPGGRYRNESYLDGSTVEGAQRRHPLAVRRVANCTGCTGSSGR